MSDSPADVKKRKFAQGVFAGMDAYAAAKAAGYRGNKKTLQECASRLMKDAVVTAELAALNAAARDDSQATRDEAIKVLTEHLRANVDDFIDDDGMIDLCAAREKGKLHLIEKVTRKKADTKHGTSENVSVSFYSKHGAIDRLAKLLGWNEPEKHEHNVHVSQLSDVELKALAAKYGIKP